MSSTERSGAVTVAVRGLIHRYPGFVLGPVDLVLGRSTVFGLLGPNGSGKTTLINALLGYLSPSSGSVEVLGEPPRADGGPEYARIGYCPDEDDLVAELSAQEYWDVCAAVLQGAGLDPCRLRDRAASLIDRLQFAPPPRLIGGYSHGMKRKTQIVAALMHEPDVVVLDEPTNGLDPIAAYALGEILADEAARGATVLVASHDLAWAERFTDRATMVYGGRVSAAAPTRELLRPDASSTLLDGFLSAAQRLGADVDR
jgi:ABC-2 type transport system ATP-binding protein